MLGNMFIHFFCQELNAEKINLLENKKRRMETNDTGDMLYTAMW